MKLFRAGNTSSEWWVIAPDEEIAITYSYLNTSTREKRNISLYDHTDFSWVSEQQGLSEMLEGNRIGIVIEVNTDKPSGSKWVFTVSHEWIPEQRTWRGAPLFVRQRETIKEDK
jgi:hypothetical protein